MTSKQPIPDEQKLALVNDAIEKLPLDLLQQVTEKRVGPMDWDAVLAEVERRGLDFYSWWTKFGLVEIMRFVRVDGGMMLRWFRSSGAQGGELPIDGNQPYPWTSKFQTCDALAAAADCLKDWKRMLTAKTAANQSAGGKPEKAFDQEEYDRKQSGLEAKNKGMTWPQVAELLGEPASGKDRVRQEIMRHAAKTKQKIKKKPAGRPRKKN
jgi:hypothetical protein